MNEEFPTYAYNDNGEIHFFDTNHREVSWHHSFPKEIVNFSLFCRDRDISIKN